MSTVTRTIMEAERVSAQAFLGSEQGVRERLREALRTLARQGLLRARANQPAQHKGQVGVAGPVRVGGMPAGNNSPGRAGTPITNNPAGQPTVRMIGQAPRPAKPYSLDEIAGCA
jgi:hypothetical protein